MSFSLSTAGPSCRNAASIASHARPSCNRKSQAASSVELSFTHVLVFLYESVTKRLKPSPFNAGVRIFCT